MMAGQKGHSMMKYSNIVPYQYRGKKYLFRYNYSQNCVEMVYKLSEEEHQYIINEAVRYAEENVYMRGIRDELDELLRSHEETGYIQIGRRKTTEVTYEIDRDFILESMCRELYKEEQLLKEIK